MIAAKSWLIPTGTITVALGVYIDKKEEDRTVKIIVSQYTAAHSIHHVYTITVTTKSNLA